MKVNKVAPWEGRLEWIDNPRTGTSKKGKPWTSVDFVLKYTDDQDNERFIMFNVFGDEKVNTVFACKPGTKLRVDWRPEAREYNGKWFGKFDAFGVTVIEEEQKPASTQLPEGATIHPKTQAPTFQNAPTTPVEEAPDADLPFR